MGRLLLSGFQSITLTDVAATGQVFQRSPGQTSGRPFIRGTYRGISPNIEAQVRRISDGGIVAAWSALTSYIQGDGLWSGYGPAVPQSAGLDYKFEVRCAHRRNVSVAGENPWGIGVVILMYGQSNELALMNFSASPPTQNAGTCFLEFPSDVMTFSAPPGDGVINVLNGIVANLGVCAMGWMEAVNGTDITFLSGYNTDHTPTNDNWVGRIIPHAAQAGIKDFELIHWHQGEARVFLTATETMSDWDYALAMQFMQANAATLTGRSSMQVFISSLIRIGIPANWPPSPGYNDMPRTAVRLGQLPNIMYTHQNTDIDLSADGGHQSGAGANKNGARSAQSIGFFYGAQAHPAKWFIGIPVATNTTTTTVPVVHSMGTDFAPASGITGFEVSGDGGATWQAPSAAVKADANTITLTHSSISDKCRMIRYLQGPYADVSACVKDNSALNVPLNFTEFPLLCSSTNKRAFPVWQPQGSNSDYLSGLGGFEITTGLDCNSGDLIIVASVSPNGCPLPDSFGGTLDSDGTPLTFTKVVSPATGCAIWQADAPKDSTWKDRWTFLAHFAGGNPFTAWSAKFFVVDHTLLNSTTVKATASALVNNASNTPPTVSTTIDTSSAADGFILAACCCNDFQGPAGQNEIQVNITGTDAFCRNNQTPVHNELSYCASHASPVTANASYPLSVAFTGAATSGDTGTNFAAAVWR